MLKIIDPKIKIINGIYKKPDWTSVPHDWRDTDITFKRVKVREAKIKGIAYKKIVTYLGMLIFFFGKMLAK